MNFLSTCTRTPRARILKQRRIKYCDNVFSGHSIVAICRFANLSTPSKIYKNHSYTRMHSSTMRIVHCSGRLSGHTCPLPYTPPGHACTPLCHTPPPLPHMPSFTMHTPLCHARPPLPHMPLPLPRMTPFITHTPFTMYAPFTTHTPLWSYRHL